MALSLLLGRFLNYMLIFFSRGLLVYCYSYFQMWKLKLREIKRPYPGFPSWEIVEPEFNTKSI
jgi:hypothetical protein